MSLRGRCLLPCWAPDSSVVSVAGCPVCFHRPCTQHCEEVSRRHCSCLEHVIRLLPSCAHVLCFLRIFAAYDCLVLWNLLYFFPAVYWIILALASGSLLPPDTFHTEHERFDSRLGYCRRLFCHVWRFRPQQCFLPCSLTWSQRVRRCRYEPSTLISWHRPRLGFV
jgi:hypothetical protein